MKLILAIVALFFITMGVISLNSGAIRYIGKEVFENETDYAQFKSAVGNDAVIINDITVLSSAPPIVVDYNVSVKNDYVFPYGEKDNSDASVAILFIIGGSCLLIVPIVWFIQDLRGS